MRTRFSIAVLCLLALVSSTSSLRAAEETADHKAARLRWWREARFGMFIHWGPVSLKGTEIGWSRGAEVPVAEYDTLYRSFNPTKFDARAWVALAKEAGMKYVVLTSKHHDGFCLWDTRLTDYKITNTPFGRDVVKELAAECRRQGIRFCLYHSILDWHHPDYPLGPAPGGGPKRSPDMGRYLGYLRGQLDELLTRYGPIGILWFDGQWEYPWQLPDAAALESHLRALQPDIIINNRIGVGGDGSDRNAMALGDYLTPEQQLGRFNRATPWETCMTICQQWAWKPDDKMKPLAECVRNLVTCAGGDGNLLLNVGPMPTGEIEARQAERLREIGAWLRTHGESVYGTTGGPFKPSKRGVSTCRGSRIYLHLFGQPDGDVTLPALPAKVLRAHLLHGAPIPFRRFGQQVTLSMDGATREEIDIVVVLELDRAAESIAPVEWKD